MAALDFPAAPAPGDTFTQNGVTYTFDGNAWVLGQPQIPPVGPTVQIKRTSTDNNPPAALKEGELAIEMGTPLRLWVGVPPAIDPSGKKLVAFMGAGDPYVDITGDTMTGDLAIMKDAPKLTLNRLTVAGGAAEVIGMLAGVRRWAEQYGNTTVEGGADSGSNYQLIAYNDAGAAKPAILVGDRASNRMLVAGDPTVPLGIATKQYVDAGGAIPMTPYELGAAYSGFQINGNMEISQENNITNTPIAANSSKYSCDVWLATCSMGAGISFTTAQMQGGNCPGFPCSLRLTVGSAGAVTPASEYANITQYYEGTRWNKLQWGQGVAAKPITISFWVFTDSVGPFPLTGTVNVRNAAVNRSYCVEYQVTAQSVWQFKTVTIPGCPDGVWEVANNTNAANLHFVFAGGPGVRIPPNAWTNTAAFAGTNQSNFFSGINHSVQITGVTVLPGSQVPNIDRYPFITRRHDQEFLNVQRWFRLLVWTMEGYSGGAQMRLTTPHQFNAMRQPPAITRAQVGSIVNIRAADPANFVTCVAAAEGGAITSMESNAAGYTQAVNFIEKMSARF